MIGLLDILKVVMAAIVVVGPMPMMVRAGLKSCFEDKPVPELPLVRYIAFNGAILAGLSATFSGHGGWEGIVATLLGGYLLTSAYVDRETGWAPDILLYPVAMASLLLAGLLGSWGMSLSTGILAALLLYPVVMALWIALRALTPLASMLPPNDLLSLLVPVILFGYGLGMAYLVVVGALLVAVRFTPFLRRIFLQDQVARAALTEMELSEDRAVEYVTLLVVSLPVAFFFLPVFFAMGAS